MKEKNKFQPVISSDVCLAYELLHKNKLVSFPLTTDAKIKVEAMVASVNGLFFGQEIYKSLEEKAVAYLYFLIKNHPFIDGNKRTAVLVFRIVCSLNKLKFNEEIEIDALAVFIEKIQETDHQSVIKMIAKVVFSSGNVS